MTAAIITLAIALVGALSVVGVLAYYLRDSLADSRASLAAENVANRAQIDERLQKHAAEKARDEALARAEAAEVTAARAVQRLTLVEKQRNDAFAKGIEHATEAIKLAPDGAAALQRLNELLQAGPKMPERDPG
jgi:crotonobetainyl-CoA:carnitine CoA-transferase CaiB-like acyl-CoA transferase